MNKRQVLTCGRCQMAFYEGESCACLPTVGAQVEGGGSRADRPLLAPTAAHTAGEWAYVAKLTASENHKGFRLFDSEGHWLADVSPRDEDGIEGEANARLMAAAPALLAALETVFLGNLRGRETHEIAHTLGITVTDATGILAAIAAAKGEAWLSN